MGKKNPCCSSQLGLRGEVISRDDKMISWCRWYVGSGTWSERIREYRGKMVSWRNLLIVKCLLPLAMGAQFQRARGPTPLNWPIASSRKYIGFPARTSITRYGTRNAPATSQLVLGLAPASLSHKYSTRQPRKHASPIQCAIYLCYDTLFLLYSF